MLRLVRAHHTALEMGDPALAAEALAPDWHNRESGSEPEPCRRPGPAGLMATSAWLRAAFSDLKFHEKEILVDGDRVIWWGTMSGRHTGPFVVVDESGPMAFPATGAAFEFEQVHWHRFRDGLMVEHRAVRKDLDLMKTLGYLPPTPAGLWRIVRSKVTRSAPRAIRDIYAAAQAAADQTASIPTPTVSRHLHPGVSGSSCEAGPKAVLRASR
jgi:predicted ester cyclase